VLRPGAAPRRILCDLAPLAPERVPLSEAPGRVLVEARLAPAHLRGVGAWTADGYALQAADAADAGPRPPIAVEAYTGHPAPAQADAGLTEPACSACR